MEILESLGIDWKLLLGQIINFLVVLYVLKRFAYQPFLDVLNKRQNKIASGIKKSEEAERRIQMVDQQTAKVLSNTQKRASQILKQSEDRAKIKADQIIDASQSERKEILTAAEQRGQAEIEKMRKGQGEKMMDAGLSLAEKILQEKIDIKKDQRIIKDFLANLCPQNGKGSKNEN